MNICPNCQKETENPKFCNRSCSVTWNNKVRPKRSRTSNIPCIVCGKRIERHNRLCCSMKCRTIYSDSTYNTNFLSTGFPALSTGGLVCSRRVKKSLIQIRGNKCEICSVETWQGKDLIKILDHIDGNAENWNINNLRLVCSNCDSQLPTYKAKNTGNGRHSRRERYKDGKSY